MAVSASNKKWLPNLFAVIGRLGTHTPTTEDPVSEPLNANPAEPPKPGSDAPINALLLSALLSSLYIILGNFRALLTFNGLGEYTFFLITVIGVVVLRIREPGLRRPYKPNIAVPLIFAVVSGFVVIRGAAFAPVQAGVLIGVWALGLLFYYLRRWLYHETMVVVGRRRHSLSQES